MVHMVTFSGMNVCGQFGETTTEMDEVTCAGCLAVVAAVDAEEVEEKVTAMLAAHEVNLLEKMWRLA